MDFKLNREIFTASETASDNGYEQAIELDYILPDYYPDIFRVLKCRLFPRIVSQSINGDKLTYELCAVIRIMYVSENSDKLCCIEQKLTYTRSCDIPSGLKNPCISVTAKADYINCRVVNQRRLDLRAAATCKVKLCSEKGRSAVSDACGCGIQLYHEPVTYPTARLYASKRITIVEELELGDTKPPVSTVIRSDCIATLSEKKLVSGKLVVKGEAYINVLYGSDGEANSLETMRFSVPFSQIIDAPGIDERFESYVDLIQSGCNIIVKGENQKTLECEIVLLVNCRAVRYETGELVTDVYSTGYDIEVDESEEKIETVPVSICEPHSHSARLVCQDGEIAAVYDNWCSVSNVSGRYSFDKNSLIVSGNLSFALVGRNDAGMPIYLETDTAFEHLIESECATQDSIIEPKVEIVGCSYTLTDSTSAEIKAELSICGTVSKLITKRLVTDIRIPEEQSQRDKSSALKLYFAKSGERVWDIAKKYRVSLSAVISENDLAADVLSEDKMLLIPDIN